jgi:putative nucleotidyltransferase with HDIG domain
VLHSRAKNDRHHLTAMTTTDLDDDPRFEALLREAPSRDAEPLSRRDRLAESAMAVALLLALAAMAAWLPAPKTSAVGLAIALFAMQVVAHRVRFTVGSCFTAPTQIAVVPMLLLLHPALAVGLIAASGVVGRLPEIARGRMHPDHAVFGLGDAWYAVGPALVLGLAAPGDPIHAPWPVLLAALAAQLVADNVATAIRLRLALGVAPDLQVRLQAIGFSIDAALAPVGYLLALVAVEDAGMVFLVLPMLGLLAMLGQERERRMEHALHLSEAYRGSALLMGEMLEADDAYTGGEHTKGVLALALELGQELGFDARLQRDLEFGALLHDIGKLRVPEEILNKPGKLTPAEWEIMKRHPEDGQEMLDRIGGVLADVGLIVRHHHERWDGRGYPDGLAGEDIPLAARIITICDSYNAMTTDRPYRKAMSVSEALDEVRTCTGTQFDPAVAEALERILAREAPPARLSALLAAA